jgi:hypothetical protein
MQQGQSGPEEVQKPKFQRNDRKITDFVPPKNLKKKKKKDEVSE